MSRFVAEYLPTEYKTILNNFLNHSMVVAHTMCYINSTINPFIYYFMSSAFRKQFRKLLCVTKKEIRNNDHELVQFSQVKINKESSLIISFLLLSKNKRHNFIKLTYFVFSKNIIWKLSEETLKRVLEENHITSKMDTSTHKPSSQFACISSIYINKASCASPSQVLENIVLF